MSLAPVFYTLAQVQFNPITQMSDYVARLQDRLRRSGFPDFRNELQFGLAIRRLDESPPEVYTQQQKQWSFMNAERTEGYLLFENTLVFHTTEYDTFKAFLQKMLFGLNLIHEVIELAYIERIGLRYLDAVVPASDDTLQEYLNASLLGLSANLDGQLGHSFAETTATVEDGTLVARTVITDGSLALPPDLFPLQLELQPRFTAIKDRSAVLDTDYFSQDRKAFDLPVIEAQLIKSHNVITKTFKASVTDYARAKWA
jgi:uncharacterized protein (TIGR04255 family)